MHRTRIASFVVVLFVSMIAAAPKGDKKSSSEPVLLLARAVEASAMGAVANAWFSAVTESYYRLRLKPASGFELVPVAKLRKEVPGFEHYGRSVPQSTLLSSARSLGATHILTHNYEVDPQDGSVYYYVEVFTADDNDIVVTFEKSFALANLGKNIDECVAMLLEKLEIKPGPKVAKVMEVPLLSKDPRSIQQLGAAIFEAQELEPGRAAQGFTKVTAKDAKMALAYYEAAKRFAAVPDYSQAAAMLDHLIVQNNLTIPSLYAELSRYYRLSKSYQRALHIVTRAEKEGWSTLELALEKAQILEKTGKAEQAAKAYAKVLSIDPDQPDALLLMARRNRKDKEYSQAIAQADRLIEQGTYVSSAQREKGLALKALNKTAEAEKALLAAAKDSAGDAEVNAALADLYSKAGKHEKAARYYEKALEGMPNSLDVLLKVVSSYKTADKPQDALAVLVKNQKHFYTSKEVTKEIGLLEFAMRDTAGARKHLEASVGMSPPDPNVFLALGDIYTASKEYKKAIEMYSKAESLVDKKLKPQMALAELYVKTEQPNKALPYLEKVIQTKASYPKANLLKADVLYGKKDYRSALKAYLAERKYHGNSAVVQAGVARCYYQMNDLPNARLGFEKLVDLDPKSAEGYYHLAVISLKLKKLDQVREYIAQAEVLGKKDPSLYLTLAEAYTDEKQYEKAAEAYRSGLAANQKNESGWVGLAKVYEKAKKDSLAADAYFRAYQLDTKKNGKLLARAGHILYDAGARSQAQGLYEEFLAKGHTDPMVNMNLARMLFADKQYEKVVSLLSKVKDEDIKDPDIYRVLAKSYAAMKKPAEALTYAKKLIAKDPKDIESIELAAKAYEATGDLKNASLMYQKYVAVPKAPKAKEYAYHLGTLLMKAKQESLALKQFRQNIQKYPGDYRNHIELGKLLLATNQYKDVVKLVGGVAKKDGAPPVLNLYVAKASVQLKSKEQAAAAYERYLDKAQQDSSAWAELGALYYENKAYKKAIPALTRAAVLMPKNVEVLHMLGMSLYHAKRYAEALDPLNKVANVKSKDKAILATLSECHRALEDTAQLISVLQKRMAVEQGNYEVSSELGRLLMAKGDMDQAVRALEAASQAKPDDVGLHMTLAGLYAKRGEPQQQLIHIDAALAKAPKNPDVTFAKARFHLLSNELKEVKTYLKKTIELNPKHVRALALHGSILKGEKRYRDAYEQFGTVSKLDPDNVEYIIEMAQCAHLTGRNDLALKVISKALKIEPDNPEVMMWAGVFYLKDNRETKALKLLTRAKEVNQDCERCDEYLGSIYLAKGEFEKAIDHLDAAARKSGRNDNVLVKLARALAIAGQPERAQKLCNKALVLNPRNDEALYVLCALYIDRGQKGLAEGVLRKHTGSRTSGWIYLAQGMVHEAKGDIASAASSYKLASRLLPNNSDMQMGLGRVYLARKKWSKAIEAFGMASALEPSNPKVFIGIGKAYFGQKNLASAKEYFAEAVRVSPGDEEANGLLAQVYSKQGEHIEAVKTLKRGLEHNSKSGVLYYRLGQEYARVKQFDDALDAFEEAEDNDEKMAAAAFKAMGDIYYKELKDEGKAKKYYKKYLGAGGNDPAVKTALQSL